ncbi:MAG TPA: PIN domain-containing protein [Actinomycetota bacterium]|nr:PIN domain-containing protein [Actinomycetota bacterium]
MIALDTSVAVAAFAPWHTLHRDAVATLGEGARLPAHAALETFAVLTRLPPPHRAPAGAVSRWLAERFPAPWLTLAPAGYRRILEAVAGGGLGGGAIHDAALAATALEHGATLVSADRRAKPVYELIGVEVDYLPAPPAR